MNHEAHSVISHLGKKSNDTVIKYETLLKSKDDEINIGNNAISQLTKQLEERDAHILSLNSDINANKNRIKELLSTISSSDRKIDMMNQTNHDLKIQLRSKDT